MFIGVCHTVWGPTVRLKRDADLQRRGVSWFSMCHDGLLAPPVGSDHSMPRSSRGAPRNPSPHPGRSWARGMLLENSIGKLATSHEIVSGMEAHHTPSGHVLVPQACTTAYLLWLPWRSGRLCLGHALQVHVVAKPFEHLNRPLPLLGLLSRLEAIVPLLVI